MNASPATKELKMHNYLKHTIKVSLDKKPDFYRLLAERLEQSITNQEARDHSVPKRRRKSRVSNRTTIRSFFNHEGHLQFL